MANRFSTASTTWTAVMSTSKKSCAALGLRSGAWETSSLIGERRLRSKCRFRLNVAMRPSCASHVIGGHKCLATTAFFAIIFLNFCAVVARTSTSNRPLRIFLRISLHDILDFCVNPKYAAMDWPKDYWPETAAPPSAEAWRASVRAIQSDLAEFEKLTGDAHSN